MAEILRGFDEDDRNNMLDILKKMLAVGNYDMQTHFIDGRPKA